MFQKGEFLKCDCGSTSFKVKVVSSNTLLFICSAEKCNRTIQIDVAPNADSITKMVTGYLSDKAKAKIMEMFLKRGED